ncbi:MAG: SDR family NAD(P)-dependent oxidoreductase, partial [Chloroflexota bacterium]
MTKRTVLITGASSGIGYATALAFARRGDNVAGSAREMDGLDQLVAVAENLPGEIMPVLFDVQNRTETERAIREVVAHFGGLDI